MKDPIVEKIHRMREAYAAMFNYDLEAIFKDVKKREERSDRKVIAPPATRRVRSAA